MKVVFKVVVGLHLSDGTKQEARQCQQPCQEPNPPQDPQGSVWVVAVVVVAWGPASSQHHVSLHTEHAEAEDAGVHVEGGEEAAEPAERLAKGPVEAQRRVGGPQGEGDQEAQVC